MHGIKLSSPGHAQSVYNVQQDVHNFLMGGVHPENIQIDDNNTVPYDNTELKLCNLEFQLLDVAMETHWDVITYGCKFCTLLDSYSNTFATCGSNSVAVYRIVNDKIAVMMNVRDMDTTETFYTLEWCISQFGEPLIAVGGSTGVLKVFSLVTKQLVQALVGHVMPIYDIKSHPIQDGLVFTASADKSVRCWNIHTGCCVACFGGEIGHIDTVVCVDINLTGTLLVSAGFDTFVKIWKLTEPAFLSRVKDSYSYNAAASPYEHFEPLCVQIPAFNSPYVHCNYIDSIRWFGDTLITKSTNNTVLLWRPDTLRYKDAISILREFQLFGSDVWFMKMSVSYPHNLIAVPCPAGNVYIYSILKTPSEDVRIKRIKKDKKDAIESGKIATPIEYGPKKKYLLGALRERFQCEFPVQPLATLRNAKTPIARECSFNSTGEYLTACFHDGSVYLWRLQVKDKEIITATNTTNTTNTVANGVNGVHNNSNGVNRNGKVNH